MQIPYAPTKRVHQRPVASIKLRLVEAKHKRSIVRSQHAQAFEPTPTQLINFLGARVRPSIIVGCCQFEGFHFLFFKWLCSEPF